MGDESRSSAAFFAEQDLCWVEEDVLMWSIPRRGEVAEYKLVMFPAVEAVLKERVDEGITERPGLIIDVRRAGPPDAAARAAIRSGLRRLRTRVSGIALLLPDSSLAVLLGGIAEYLMGDGAGSLSRHHDQQSAIDALRARAQAGEEQP